MKVLEFEKKIEKEIKKEIKYIELKYSSLFYFLISILIVIFLVDPNYFSIIENFLSGLGNYGIFGIFIAGAGYTSTFTSPISAVAMYAFGEFYSPLFIASLGALGSLIVDSIFYFTTKKIIKNPRKVIIVKFPKHKLIEKFSFLIGFFIIASPLPDELGAAFLSIFEKDYKTFALISYMANFTGILFFSLFGAM